MNNNTKYDNINVPVFHLIWTQQKVLDIGCWNGALWKALIKEKKCVVHWVDYLDDVLNNATKNVYEKTFLKNFNMLYTRDIDEK
jgi:2-polyprenyl-3-methyl-5-hydroxy-6-metoxy-1,4-benzoquinol methylase